MRDVRVKRGTEIGSDHYLLVMYKAKSREHKRKEVKQLTIRYTVTS